MPRVNPPIPVFVGGTGRSGTTILGDLLGAHPEIALSKPTEIKFFSNAPGLIGRCFGQRNEIAQPPISLLHPRTRYLREQKVRAKRSKSLEEFKEIVDQRWWAIDAPAPHGPGLVEGITRSEWDALIAQLSKSFPKNPKKASANFLNRYIVAQNNVANERYWVETTPFNIREADRISALLPQSRFIHMARDPRDVIASLLTMAWGPNTALEGIEWVEERLMAGHRALSAIDPKQILHLSLEELTTLDREGSMAKIMNFLALEPSPAMETFFEATVTPQGAKGGRWRNEIQEPAFDAAFEAMCRRLDSAGVHYFRQ